ncbi:hypothetical protein OKA04_21250 [Luteolibacter flavescens]|uniref:Uncharacterized protein n=1 Tax=Luteolibacter flavescens TaxID=1859460 RepID=A0ABT3FVD5_9BACT|nr:hypothetical protein [Luteolibacter flavescens]MCW1887279.1 hypothetical protein [Luteolibacter flavescens]
MLLPPGPVSTWETMAMELEPGQRAFVDAVMQPLGDDPQRRELLEEAIALSSTLPCQTSSDDVHAASERMRRGAPGFLRRHRISQALLVLVGAVTAWFVIAGPPAWKSILRIWDTNQLHGYLGSMCCTEAGVPSFPSIPGRLADGWETAHALEKLPASEALLIVGAPEETDPVLKWRRVWESHPNDAAHYMAYALAYRQKHQKWPADLVETGERLDPGNGWFRFLDAVEAIKSSMGDAPPPPAPTREERLAARGRGEPPPRQKTVTKPERVVLDPAGLARGWQELDIALAMPRFDDLRRRQDAIRASVWPAPVDYCEYYKEQFLAFAQPEDVTSGWLDARFITEAFGKTADHAGKEDMELLEARLKAVSFRMGAGSDHTIRSLVMRRMTRDCAIFLGNAWNRIGEADRAKPWEDFAKSTDPKLAVPHPSPADALTQRQASSLVTRNAYSYDRRDPASAPITEPEVRGGRLAEYAMYERLMLHAIALLLIIALGFLLLAPLRDRRSLGLLPARLAGLLDRRDRLRIATMGIVLPVGLYLLSTHPPGLINRQHSITEHGFILWLAQSAALVVAVILGILQTARRQLGQRGGMLSLGWIGPDPGRICFPAALLAIPLGSLLPKEAMRWHDAAEIASYATIAGLVGFPLLWLLWQAVGCFNGPSSRILHRSVLLHAAAPFASIALVVVTAAIPWAYATEKAWTKQIRYEAFGPGNTVFEPRLEREHASWLARDMLERLEAVK